MPRSPARPEKAPQISVLDRLLLGGEAEPEGRNALARRLREAVRRDLEALFNTRPLCRSWPRDLRELDRSILSYGLPDLQSRTVITDEQREGLRREVEAVIRRFEPRLHEPVVEYAASANPLDRSLRFRIHGRLVLEAGGDAVVYDTRIDPASREIRILPAERDRDTGEA
ncbi:type VI secretion system baseplate subunit TssE [Methylobacterium sp. NEAU 140]|uniref:type VI secretion system baseplate subunit TssE n=1 Tax=Methylobacterium sp. NEAU 140 TaxID=3064945 RepID=UPI0027370D36|nr:type VI secretion system baseplate subunit TssE [Methylobacterium sp. NEAU 140]MDP4025120.1 type VI secretion system baseplate subunit TssE [Methylobacterium sp. NEAU 140]